MPKTFTVDFENTPFLSSSETGQIPNRLNWRAEILLTKNRPLIENRRILDLGSHDGRFSYACLRLGASHVTGVEGRGHLVQNARNNLRATGYNEQIFTMLEDDVFRYLPTAEPETFDTILCLGFFYHTTRQIELLREIVRLRPAYFIIDTYVEKEMIEKSLEAGRFLAITGHFLKRTKPRHIADIKTSVSKAKRALRFTRKTRPCLVFKYEDAGDEGATIDAEGVVAWPTQSLIEFLFQQYGFPLKKLDWHAAGIEDWTALADYKLSQRLSYIVTMRSFL
jgi:2-polyprenyl-3-methyl-5-hydroxy-6-metoxy-1,4-benzoquinol methylase